MSEIQNNLKKKMPVIIVAAVAVLLLAVVLVLAALEKNLDARQAADLRSRQQETQEENDRIDQEYAVALSEFEQERSEKASESKIWPAVKAEGWDILDLTNYELENPFTFTSSRENAMNEGMLLVNEWHPRPDDFSENALVSIGKNTDSNAKADKNLSNVQVANYNLLLFPKAVTAIQRAITDAAKAGYGNYIIDAAYRSYADQEALFNAKMDKFKDTLSGDALVARAKKDVNYPGTSEFNSGLSFTLKLYKKNDKEVNSTTYVETPESHWMNENCWKYGLVFRFPKTDYPEKGTVDKSYKTGVTASLRCYRYVGEGNAAVMHAKDFCLEEYIEFLMEHPHIAAYEDGVLKYEISRQYVGDASEFQISVSSNCLDYSVSLDNMGYAIVVMNY